MKDEDQTILPRLQAMGASIAGLAIALAPFTGATIMAKTGTTKWVPAASGAISLAHAAFNYFALAETLPQTQRRPFKWSGASPLAFTQFFTAGGLDGRRMKILALAVLLGALRSDMHDTRMVMLKTKLGFGPKEVGNYMLGSGGTVMLQGHASGVTMRTFGLVKHTYIALLLAICEQFCWSVATGAKGLALACMCGVLGNTYANGITHMLAQTGERALGIGRGQLQAMLSNMNTVVKIPGPLLFATVFRKFGQPAPFRLAATLLACAGLTFSLLPAEEKKKVEDGKKA